MKYASAVGARLFFLIAATAATGACWWYYTKNSSRLAMATSHVQSCRMLAAQIAGARQAPRRAQLATRTLEDLGGVIEKAAADSTLSRDRVLRIDPQPAKRLGKTDYLEQATEVELLAVSLRQLVELLYNVGRNDDQLAVDTLRLRMPHGATDADGPELWLADVVLSQRIYAPATSR